MAKSTNKKAVVSPVLTKEEQFEVAIRIARDLFILMEGASVGQVFTMTGSILGK